MRKLTACLLAVPVTVATTAAVGSDHAFSLKREVVNLEGYSGTLSKTAGSGDVWRGTIPRRLALPGGRSERRDVPFEVEFRSGLVARARADVDLDGSLADDGDLKLSLYPGETPTRSFLVPIRDRLTRVVVAPPTDGPRAYFVQEVYGMLGSVEVGGRSVLALLYDADHDGSYTVGSGDGVFFDVDGDRHFPIDVMAPEFGPFGAPFTLGKDAVTVETVEPDGSRLSLKTVGPADPLPAPMTGATVPDFVFFGIDGKTRLLSAQRGKPVVVYFWDSGCESCDRDAGELQSLYTRWAPERLEILGVSYDADRRTMDRFRQEHRITWPTSFTGGVPALDPMGRTFREERTGVYYVIGADGRLAAKVTELGALSELLSTLIR